jgi:hypothetical protein
MLSNGSLPFTSDPRNALLTLRLTVVAALHCFLALHVFPLALAQLRGSPQSHANNAPVSGNAPLLFDQPNQLGLLRTQNETNQSKYCTQ